MSQLATDEELERLDKLIHADDPSAFEEARRLTEQYPNDVRTWADLAYYHGRNDQYDEAIAAATRGLEVSPGEPALHNKRGRIEFERGNLEAALADFTAGINSCHEHQHFYYLESFHFIRADVLVRLKRFEEARADLAHVKDGYKFWTTSLVTKTELLEACDGKEWDWERVAVEGTFTERLEAIDMGTVRNPPKGLEYAKRLAAEFPGEPDAWDYLAYSLVVNEDYLAAVDTMQKAIDIEPDEPAWYFHRAEHRIEIPDIAAALADLEEAAKRCDAENRAQLWVKIQFYRADMFLRLGRKAEARAALENVPDGYALRIIEIRTKKELLAACDAP